MIAGFKDDIVEVLEPFDIYRIFAASGKVFAETNHGEYTLRLRLYEMEQRLDSNFFVRISNSDIINLRKVRVCDNGSCKIYNLDYPDVIAVRNEMLSAGEREKNIPCDLNDTEWFTKIDASNGAVFFASGVFYYFLTEQVKAMVQKMANTFPDGVLVFDAANRMAVKMIAKTWLKSAKIQDVGAYFAVSDAPKEIGAWDSRLQVTSRGYMLGYNDLRDSSVSSFFRFLAKVGDNQMKMQIVKIRFEGRNYNTGK